MAALAIDKAGPRPYHFCPGPTSGPTTRPQEVKEVKIKFPVKFSIRLITRHLRGAMATKLQNSDSDDADAVDRRSPCITNPVSLTGRRR